MKKHSAGLLVYRKIPGGVEVLIVHPGGPFWAKKDLGAWSIPKGEYEPDEEPLEAAKREFKEETGQLPPEGELIELGDFKRSDGRLVIAWAVEGDLNVSTVTSNMFEMDWPPKSGQKQSFPEVDKAQWIALNNAGPKMHKGQDIFLERLAEKLGVEMNGKEELIEEPKQQQLL